MKNLVIVVFILGIACSVRAQTERGNWLIGGWGNFDFYNSFSISSTHERLSRGNYVLQLAPTVGYFVRDNFCVGAGYNFLLAFEHGTFAGPGALGYFNGSMLRFDNGLSIFMRKYHGKKALRYFTMLGAGVAKPIIFGLNSEYRMYYELMIEQAKETVTGQVNLGPGLAWFISPRLAVEGVVQLKFVFSNFGDTNNFLLGYNIGLQYYFMQLKRGGKNGREEKNRKVVK